ncbi:7648_t:CDS:2, partial [Gigaspora rosea]
TKNGSKLLTTGKVITNIAEASLKDVDLVVKAATEAFIMFGDLLMGKNELAALESFNNKQTLSTAKFIDVGLSIDCYRYFARWTDKIHEK